MGIDRPHVVALANLFFGCAAFGLLAGYIAVGFSYQYRPLLQMRIDDEMTPPSARDRSASIFTGLIVIGRVVPIIVTLGYFAYWAARNAISSFALVILAIVLAPQAWQLARAIGVMRRTGGSVTN